MKRFLLLLLSFAVPVAATAQTSQEKCQQNACSGYGAPTGSCSGSYIYSDTSVTPVQGYSCKAGAWAKQGGSGSGGGATIAPVTNLISGDGSGNGVDSGVASTAISTAQTTANAATSTANAAQTTANAAIPASQKAAASGVATLDSTTKLVPGQLPSATNLVTAIGTTPVQVAQVAQGVNSSGAAGCPLCDGFVYLGVGNGTLPSLGAGTAGWASPLTGNTPFVYRLPQVPPAASSVLVAAPASTTSRGVSESITTTLPLAGSGAGVATGPATGTTANNGVCYADTVGTLKDCLSSPSQYVLLSSALLQTINSPLAFTGTSVGTTPSVLLGGVAAAGAATTPPMILVMPNGTTLPTNYATAGQTLFGVAAPTGWAGPLIDCHLGNIQVCMLTNGGNWSVLGRLSGSNLGAGENTIPVSTTAAVATDTTTAAGVVYTLAANAASWTIVGANTGKFFSLSLKQDATGGRVWPAAPANVVNWTPPTSTAANFQQDYLLQWDGTVWRNLPLLAAGVPQVTTGLSASTTLISSYYHNHVECNGTTTPLTLPAAASLPGQVWNIINISTTTSCTVSSPSTNMGNGTLAASQSLSPGAAGQYVSTGVNWRVE